MATKRPFTPDLINKADRHLLVNDPVTWSTRIHLTMYYGIAFSAFLVLICFIVPEDPRNYSTIYNWVILLIVVSLLAFITWMIYLLRFNVFKRYGKWKKTDSAKTFVYYFITVCLIVSWPFIPPVVQSARANMAFSGQELVRDINSMNIKLCQLERDSISTKFSRDTLKLMDSTEILKRQIVSNGDDNYTLVYSAILKERLSSADSIRQINDSMYVLYECPDYQFVNSYFNRSINNPGILSSMDLFNQVLNKKESFDAVKVQSELSALLVKYKQPKSRTQWYGTVDYTSDLTYPSYTNKLQAKYGLDNINSSIHNIVEKKYRWDSDTIKFSYRLLYYITLVLVLLIAIYRHTTRRTFFLSLLAAVVLTILTSLFLAMQWSSAGAVFTWIEIYFICFGVAVITINISQMRNVVSGIALNLFVFLTPFMPLVVTASYYSNLEERYYGRWEEKAYLFRNRELHSFIAEIGGFILLLLLMATLYQAAYRKWYALPQQ